MNVDATTMKDWARRNGVKVHDDVIHSNVHDKVTNEKTFSSVSAFRSAFQSFLRDSPEKHLIFAISTHGTPFDYVDENRMTIQGEGIVITKGGLYTDQMLSQDVNVHFPKGKYLWLIIDTCFSGGLLNLWQIKDRLDRNIVLFSGANSEIVGWGNSLGGYLTRRFTQFAEPGRYTFHIADDVIEKIEREDQDDFSGVISTQIKYSRPILAGTPFLVA